MQFVHERLLTHATSTPNILRLRVARTRRQAAQRTAHSQGRAITRLRSALTARDTQIKAGSARLSQVTVEAQVACARVAELEARVQRADALIQKLEDRRLVQSLKPCLL